MYTYICIYNKHFIYAYCIYINKNIYINTKSEHIANSKPNRIIYDTSDIDLFVISCMHAFSLSGCALVLLSVFVAVSLLFSSFFLLFRFYCTLLFVFNVFTCQWVSSGSEENGNDLKVHVFEIVALGVSPLLYGDFSLSQMDFYSIYEMMMAAALLSKKDV